MDMTRITMLLLAACGALATAVITPALALNPQPLPPRCVKPCPPGPGIRATSHIRGLR